MTREHMEKKSEIKKDMLHDALTPPPTSRQLWIHFIHSAVPMVN